ncbi:CYTH domain-containing protein [Alkalihalophilus lindianensis]|uniref:CYTH domain-containing protein n=1 Tax=Alkalihalophilus lindianensis TaxID=1630542 RepID=A0ABU3XB09_9BACI|nr:CYTH domain-containing protein [Alkalihalophilus lindianensis]MDV2685076.1 CYTH domain-containing protein [Alkalihalophilus lindianensis]
MTQEIEIEVKSLVDEPAFSQLLQFLNKSMKQAVMQKNHYFETTDQALKQAKSALRIREKNNTFTLTLKEPYQDGLLETHQTLSSLEVDRAIKEGDIPRGEVMHQLKELDINPATLSYLGTLTTERLECDYKNGALCFDKSTYLGQVDYEIEFEGNSLEHATHSLESLFSENGIKQVPTPNKVQRFFERKQALND